MIDLGFPMVQGQAALASLAPFTSRNPRRKQGPIGGFLRQSKEGPRATAMRLLIPALLFLAACARTVTVMPPSPPIAGAEEAGVASWYGHPYHGRRTASGEVYDMNDLTAAHRSFPFGTRLMVTNLDTGQTVEVRVNDRGPLIEERILDLSYAAARSIGGDRAGVIPVRLRILAPGSAVGSAGPASLPSPRPAGDFAVQVGAFASRARAESVCDALARDGDMAMVTEAEVGGDTFFRERLGPYPDRETARAAAQRLAGRGHQAVVVER
jgi:rare lipoprotein A